MKSTIYQLLAILIIAVIVGVFSVNQTPTGNVVGDNYALNSKACENYYTNGVLFDGKIHRNYCYTDSDNYREYLMKYECQAGHLQKKKVDCAAMGRVCSQDECVLPRKTGLWTKS